MTPHSVHDAPYRFTQEELLAIDLEGRCVITDHEAFILFNLYGPAITSEENAAERFAYKMQLYQVMCNCRGISLQACRLWSVHKSMPILADTHLAHSQQTVW